MAIQELTPEQVRTLTLEEKDRWWRANVFKGDLPQLTIRAALTGMVLGGVLSMTNLYVGIRTGWTLGVGLTSVLVSYAAFKLLAAAHIGKEMTLLENNAMQSIATAAGYMTTPLVSSIPAYMLVTQRVVPAPFAVIWVVLTAVLGVLFAFPLKKRFINDEQLPFPEGYAAGVVLDNLHSEHGAAGVFKAKILACGGLVSALLQVWRDKPVMSAIRLRWLALPAAWDDLLYRFVTPRLLGTPLRDITIQLETSIVMIGIGGLIGMKTSASLLLGALLSYVVLAPVLIKQGVIVAATYKAVSAWTLWGGAALMTTASLSSFLSRPDIIVQAMTGVFRRARTGDATRDPLADIELPMRVFAVGIPLVGSALVLAAHWIFGVRLILGVLAIPLVFLFTVIAVNATALTALTPGSALGKLTQLFFSVAAHGDTATNVMTAGITADVAVHASNLLMDIKPGYMLGAKPRQQAIGHVLGVVAGASVAVPVFYLLFRGDVNRLTSDAMPMPNAMLWRSVAEVLTHGFGTLHASARIAMAVGAALGVLIEIANQRLRGRFPISAVALGLGIFLRFNDSCAMALGAFIFWLAARRSRDGKSFTHRVLVDNHETLCAGIIAGGSIAGIALMLVETLVLR